MLALHVLLLCAAGHTPTEMAAFLVCSRSSVYRIVRADRNETLGLRHDDQVNLFPPLRTTAVMPCLKRSESDISLIADVTAVEGAGSFPLTGLIPLG